MKSNPNPILLKHMLEEHLSELEDVIEEKEDRIKEIKEELEDNAN